MASVIRHNQAANLVQIDITRGKASKSEKPNYVGIEHLPLDKAIRFAGEQWAEKSVNDSLRRAIKQLDIVSVDDPEAQAKIDSLQTRMVKNAELEAKEKSLGLELSTHVATLMGIISGGTFDPTNSEHAGLSGKIGEIQNELTKIRAELDSREQD